MLATPGNVYQVLDGNRQYVIPVYQRTYSWQREQCEQLWKDIVKMQKSNSAGHFVGSIVNVTENAMPIGVQQFMIIDGQQRLTTLSLLLIALRDYAHDHCQPGSGPDNNEINEDMITNTHLVNMYASGDSKYKLFLTQGDRDALMKLIERSPIAEGTKSRLLDNYAFFREFIAKMELSLTEVYQSIGKLQIVNITLDRNIDDPQAIFESLNSTGIDLSQSDLIRNHLLMCLDASKQALLYDTLWHPTELLFEYEKASEHMDNFFRDYLTMKLGRVPNQKKVYEEFKIYFDNLGLETTDICKDIYSFSKHYTDMFFCRSSEPRLKSLYEEMRAVRMNVAYPFLLKVHDDCANEVIDKNALIEIIAMCVSYVLRRNVCDMWSNSHNKTFATLKNAIRPADYLNSVKAFFITQDSYKEFPNNEKFAAQLVSRDVYKMQTCNYILRKLETFGGHHIVSLDDLSVEHIFPQHPNANSNWGSLDKLRVHTLGNLTLAHWEDNSAMSNKPFDEKLNMENGYKKSALRLNAEIVTQTVWGDKQISDRADSLADIAKKVWAYPELSDAELAPYITQEETSPRYTVESYEWNAHTRILFERLNTQILNLSSVIVKRDFKKMYIAYKADTNFVDIVPQKEKLRLSINMKFGEISDPNGICRDITGLGRWGNGDVELFFGSLAELDDVMFIIEQSFRKQTESEVG
ncbi:hypothetical protein FACS1894132_10270 [Clostridia bacterium]|nr:hypothetical protein FACS1894132_10270 [Clostridia bacterium]